MKSPSLFYIIKNSMIRRYSKTLQNPVFFLILITLLFIVIIKQDIKAQTPDFSSQKKSFKHPSQTSVPPESTENEKSTSDSKESAEAIRQAKIIDRFWRLLQKRPRQGVAFDRVYAWYAQSGQMQELFEKCTQWIGQDPQNAKAFLLKGLFAQRTGDSVLALHCYDQATLLDPNSAAPLIFRGDLLARKRDLKNAADAFEKALLRNPDQEEIEKIMIPLMRLYEQLGNKDQAQNVLIRYETLFPDDPKIQWQIADSLRETGNDRLALTRFLKLAEWLKNKNGQDDRQLWIRSVLAVGNLKIQQGLSESAENDFRQLLNELDPESIQADSVQEQIARIFLRAGRFDDLIRFYRQLLKENPRQWKIVQHLAVLLIQLDRAREAASLLSDALSKSPVNFALLKTLLDLRLEERKIEEAAQIFHKIDQQSHWNPREKSDFLRARPSLFFYLKNDITLTDSDPKSSDHQTDDQNHPDRNRKTSQTADAIFHSPQIADSNKTDSNHSPVIKTDNNNRNINHNGNIKRNKVNHDNIDNIKSSFLSATKDLQTLRRAVRINPTDEKKQRELLNALDEIGQTSEAIEILWAIFDRTFQLDQKILLTKELFDHYRSISRLAVLTDRLIQGTNDPAQQRNNKICLAKIYSLSGDIESERRILTALFNENEGSRETDLDLMPRLVQLAQKQGNFAEAIRYQQILCILSNDPHHTKRLIQLYLSHGENERAHKLFLKLSARIYDPETLLHTADQLLAAANYELVAPILDLLQQFESRNCSNQIKMKISNHWKILYRQAEVLYWRGKKKEANELFKKITSLPNNRQKIPFMFHSGQSLSSQDPERDLERMSQTAINQWHLDRWDLFEKELTQNGDSAPIIRKMTEIHFDNTNFKAIIFTIFREKIRISDYYRKQFALLQKENKQNILFPRFPHYVPQTFDEARNLSFLWRIKIIFDNATLSNTADHSESFRYPWHLVKALKKEIPTDRQDPNDLESRLFLEIFPPLLYFIFSEQDKSFDSFFDLTLSEVKKLINQLALSGMPKYESCALENFLQEIIHLNLSRRFANFEKDEKLDRIVEINTKSDIDAQKLKKDLLNKASCLCEKRSEQGKEKITNKIMSGKAGELSEEEKIGWVCHWMDKFLTLIDNNPPNTDLSEQSLTAFHESSCNNWSLFYKGYFALSLSGRKIEAEHFLKRASDKYGNFNTRKPLLKTLLRQAEHGTFDLLFDYTCSYPFELLTGEESEEMKKDHHEYLSIIRDEINKMKNLNQIPTEDYSNKEILLERLASSGLDLIVLPVWLHIRKFYYSTLNKKEKTKELPLITTDVQDDLLNLLRDYISTKNALITAKNKASDLRSPSANRNQCVNEILASLFTFVNRSESPSAYELTRLLDEYSQSEQSQFIFHMLITVNRLNKKVSSMQQKKSKINHEISYIAVSLPDILKKLENEFQSKEFRAISNQINFLTETANFDENRNGILIDKKKLFHQLKTERELSHNSPKTVSPQHKAVLAVLFLFERQYSEAIQCLDEIQFMNDKEHRLREFFILDISLRDTETPLKRLLIALNRLTNTQRTDWSITDRNIKDNWRNRDLQQDKPQSVEIKSDSLLTNTFSLDNTRSNSRHSSEESLKPQTITDSQNEQEETKFSKLNEYQSFSEKELLKIRAGWQKLGKTNEANIIFNHLLAITQTPAIQYDFLKELQNKSESLSKNEIDFLQRIALRFETSSSQRNGIRENCRDLALQLLNQSGKLDQTISLLAAQLNNLQNQGSTRGLVNSYELQAELADLYLRVGREISARDLIMKMESGMAKNGKRQLEFSNLCSRANLSKMALKWRRTALEKEPDLLFDQFDFFARQYEEEKNISELILIIRHLNKDKFRLLFPKVAKRLIHWIKIPALRPQIIDYWKELWNVYNSSTDEQFKIRWTLCHFSSVNVDAFFAPFLTEFVLDSLQPVDKPLQEISRSLPDISGDSISIHNIETWTYEGIETLSLSLLRSIKDLESLKKLRENVEKIIKTHNDIPPINQNLSQKTDAVLLHVLLDLKIGDIKNALLDFNRLEKDPAKASLLENAKPMLAVFMADIDEPDCQRIAARLFDQLLNSKKMKNHTSFLIDRLNGLSVNQQIKKQQIKTSNQQIKKQIQKDQQIIKDRLSTERVGSAP